MAWRRLRLVSSARSVSMNNVRTALHVLLRRRLNVCHLFLPRRVFWLRSRDRFAFHGILKNVFNSFEKQEEEKKNRRCEEGEVSVRHLYAEAS